MDDLDLGSTVKGFIAGQKVFGRYTLTRLLGRGGMGVVWLAHDDKLERDVAVKFLPEVMMGDKLALADLKRETKRSLELTHPHIVRIYDFVDDARTAGIAMEYIAGETLGNARVDKPGRCFEVAELAAWVAQLCSALDYAHGVAQVVHRDLKPANLMVDARGHLKVTDFGIASSISDSVSRVSKQAGTSGTPMYMSPQQMMGEKPAASDDIYALGATLFDLLTGKPPFHTGNILMQVQTKVPPTIAARRAELGHAGAPIPAEWEATIAACLAKDPAERPQSAGEVAERLGLAPGGARKAESGGRQAEKQPAEKPAARVDAKARASASESVVDSSRSTTKAPLFAGIAAAVLAVAGLGWYFGIHQPEQRRLAENARLEAAEREAEALKLKNEQEKAAAEAQRLANARGGIVVRTHPAGAEVRVGAIALEKSPLTLKDQKLGKYPVRIRLDGYDDWSGEVEVKENEFADLAVALVRSTGTLSVASEPAGMEVEIRGSGTGAPPQRVRTPGQLKLPTGTYTATFRRPGWPDQTRTVEIGRNAAVETGADFVPGSLRVDSTPSGAEVWLGERRLGTTPVRLDEVQPGAAALTVRLAGFREAAVNGTVEPRQELRLGALLEKQLYPQPGQPWENTLGQKFVPVPGTGVLFGVWETRVQDFEAFVQDTQYDATAGAYTLNAAGRWGQYGGSWRSPGYAQTGLHPVSCISQADAEAFCRWLTEKERREGRLGPNQEYRLPTDAEWDAAVGRHEFPWGSGWPPPRGAGNYADAAAKRLWSNWGVIDGYDDGYAGTAPVGSFTANRYGIFDLGGNLWERVSDRVHGLQGASFYNYVRDHLASSDRHTNVDRTDLIGFRLVCVVGSVPASSSTSVVPKSGESFRIPELALEMMPIAAGRFAMGSSSGGDNDERPVTQVTLSRPFWLGKTEVTQAQWEALTGSNPSHFKGASLPVEKVSWDDAMAFCRKLTERERAAGRLPEGYEYTLPTEAQWEYACRAGTTGDYAGNLDAMGWYDPNSGSSTKPVSQKQANAWGLHDMHGNVWEWCLDWVGALPGGGVSDPTGPGSGSLRVYRGGCWGSTAGLCRSANRSGRTPDNRWNNLGFRVALSSVR